MAGPPASSARPTKCSSARPLAHQRRGDADPLGDVVQREAEDQEDAEGGLAQGEGGADGQPLAQVVQPDAERDLIGQRQRRLLLVLRAPPQRVADRRSAAPSSAAPPAGSAPARRARRPPPAPISCASSHMSTTRKASSPTVSARTKFIPRRPSRRRNGIPEQPERDRHDADVETDQREAEEALLIGLGTLDRHRDLGLEDDAGRADQRDGVRLALDPGIGDARSSPIAGGRGSRPAPSRTASRPRRRAPGRS